MIVPKRHHKDYSLLESTPNVIHASLVKEIGAILGLSNPITAEIITDGVVLLAIDGVHGMLNGLAILGVKLFDVCELAIVGAIISDELSSDSDWLG
jgi:hypothetical protein